MSDQEINVKFGATTGDLNAGTKEAAASVDHGAKSISDSIAVMSASVGESMAAFKEHIAEGGIQAKESLEGISASIKKVNETFALIAEVAIVGEIGKKFYETSIFAAEYAEKINLAAQKTGFAGDSLETLRYAAATANVGFDQLQSGLEKFDKASVAAREGNVKLQGAFDAVGVSMADLKSMSPEQLMDKVADAFAKTTDNGDKTAIAIQLFGKAGAAMIPILDKGSEGLRELGDEASSVGGIMGVDARENAQKFAEQLKLSNEAANGLKLNLSSQLQPAMQATTTAFIESCKEGGNMRQMLSGVAEIIKEVTGLFVNASAVVVGFGKFIGTLGAVIDTSLSGGGKEQIRQMWIDFGNDIDADQAKLDKFFDDMNNPPAQLENNFGLKDDKTDWDGKEKSSLHAAGDNKVASQMAAFEGELERMRAQNTQKEALQSDFQEFSKSQEVEFWAQKLSSQSLNAVDRTAIEKKYYAAVLDVQKGTFQADIEGLRAQEAQYGISGDQRQEKAAEVMAAIIAKYGEESKEGQAAIKEFLGVYKAAMAEKMKLADTAAKAAMDSANNQLSLEEGLWKLQQSKMSSSMEDQIAMEQQFATRKYQIKLDELNKELDAAKGNETKTAQLQAQIASLTQQYDNTIALSNAKAAQTFALNWNSAISGIQSSMAKCMTDIVMHTTSAGQAMRSLMLGIGQAIVNMLAQTAAAWAIDHAKKMIFSSTESTADGVKNAALIAGVTAVGAANVEAAKLSIAAWAGVAGAAGVASMAAAPWPIDMTAPEFGASMNRAAQSFAVASASGGYDIPSGVNPVTQLHQEEMVLPAKYANALRDMTNNTNSGGGSGGAGDVHLHVTAMDAKSVQDYFRTNSHTLAPALRRMARNLTPVKG